MTQKIVHFDYVIRVYSNGAIAIYVIDYFSGIDINKKAKNYEKQLI